MKSEILISGGLGFIGSSLTERILEDGMDVTIVDNCTSNVSRPSDILQSNARMTFFKRDISEYLTDLSQEKRFRAIVHTASHVGAAGVLEHIGHIAQTMIKHTADVIDFCVRTGSDLIFISSSEVYGRNGIVSEKCDIRVPPYFNARIEYALGKLTSEAMIHNARHRGLRALCVRPFNVVGPRQSRAGGFVLPTFVQQALGGRELTIFPPGSQIRSFLSVDDLADFVVVQIRSKLPDDPVSVNVSCPANSMTITELALRVKKLLNSESPLEVVDPRDIYGPLFHEAASVDKRGDIQQAQRCGWFPKRDIDSIILTAANYYRNCRDTRGADARDEPHHESHGDRAARR